MTDAELLYRLDKLETRIRALEHSTPVMLTLDEIRVVCGALGECVASHHDDRDAAVAIYERLHRVFRP